MGNKLLVRAYNVEVGDCIYCRIPDARPLDDGSLDDFHMLIDCGSKSSEGMLKDAIKHLESNLPSTDDGKKRLDLLVVTHEHQDHIKGFNPAFFKNIAIGNIWMSVAMDLKHPQAKQTHNLHNFAKKAMRDIAKRGVALSPGLADLADLYSIGNDDAMKALRVELPEANNIKPVFVHAGMKKSELKLPISNASIRVLGPEADIDGYYLGEEADPTLRGIVKSSARFGEEKSLSGSATPDNISHSEFRQLKNRMIAGSFAFAELESRVKNNTSAVLLIEWKGKRLLFVGDCEWEHKYREKRKNGGWNVMWHKRKELLKDPIDFLKIGHHGSVNSTPWNDKEDGKITEPSTILDAILPIPKGSKKPTAMAIASTRRKNYQTIPSSALLVEIGKRVKSVRSYKVALTRAGFNTKDLRKFENYEKAWISKHQPLRTDLEHILKPVGYVDVEIGP